MLKRTSLALLVLFLAGCVAAPQPPSQSSSGSNSNSSSSSSGSPAGKTGQEYYLQRNLAPGVDESCADCHGVDGKGVPSKASSFFEGCVSCSSLDRMESFILSTMPSNKPNACIGDCATKTAEYIFSTLLGKVVDFNCDDAESVASPLRRLNKHELANAFADTFGTDPAVILEKLPDSSETGLGTITTVGGNQSADFGFTVGLYDAAVAAVTDLVESGKLTVNSVDDVANTLKPYGKLLFRRDLTTEEVDELDTVARNAAQGFNANTGLKAAIMKLLVAPDFLFVAPSEEITSERRLTGKELAERLALTLWITIPDEDLLQTAASGGLDSPAGLSQQVDRMVADAKFQRFLALYPDQWLSLPALGAQVTPNGGVSDAEWQTLRADMRMETATFIAEAIRNNVPVGEIYSADYTYANKRLADFYSIPSKTNNNNDYVKTPYPKASRRAGILSHGSTLSARSDGEGAPIAFRGEAILGFTCEELGDIPDTLGEAINGNAALNTWQEKLDARAANPICEGCHRTLDPAGWAFTPFDHMGRVTDSDPDGNALDPSGEIFGMNFTGPESFVSILEEEDLFEPCLSTYFLTYSLGRVVNYAHPEDQCAINAARTAASSNGQVLVQDLIKSLIKSDAFTKTGPRVAR